MSKLNEYFAGGGSYQPAIDKALAQLADYSALLVGSELSLPPHIANDHPGLIPKNGGEYSRKAYPFLWNWLERHPELVITDAEYDAVVKESPINACSMYSSGDGSSTFRVPTIGKGGFARSVVTTDQSKDAGFGSKIEDHSHATVVSDISSTPNRPGFNFNTSPNESIFSRIQQMETSAGDRQVQGCAPTTSTANANWGSYTTSGTNVLALTSTSTHENLGETAPQGFYVATYIYTGNTLSNLPTPTPDWLAQQQVLINEIAKLQQVPNENLLINGCLSVNQRNDQTTDGGWLADRFKIYGSTSYNITKALVELPHVTLGSYGIITFNQDTNYRTVRQIVEKGASKFKGRTVTFSCWVNSSITTPMNYELQMYYREKSGSYKISLGTVPPNSSWTKLKGTIKIPEYELENIDDSMEVNLLVNPDATVAFTDRFRVTAFKLEMGELDTPFVPDDSAINLIKCQRYFYQANKGNNSWLMPSARYGTSGTLHYATIQFPVTMRATPVMSTNTSGLSFTQSSPYMCNVQSTSSGSQFVVNDIQANAEL